MAASSKTCVSAKSPKQQKEKQTADRGATWSLEEVEMFLDFWGEEEVQRQLDGSTRNSHVFDKIVKRMVAAGYARSASQCRIKIKALKREYRVIKDHNNKSGSSHKISRYDIILFTFVYVRAEVLQPVLLSALPQKNGRTHGVCNC